MQTQSKETLALLEEIMIPSANKIISDRFNSNEADSASDCGGQCDSGTCRVF